MDLRPSLGIHLTETLCNARDSTLRIMVVSFRLVSQSQSGCGFARLAFDRAVLKLMRAPPKGGWGSWDRYGVTTELVVGSEPHPCLLVA